MNKHEQTIIEINESNQMVFVESRTMRDQHVYRDEIIEKVKSVAFLTDNFEVTVQMASEYYEVPIETIRTIIKRNRDEFNEYEEIRLLKGKVLKDFKAMVQLEPDLKSVPSLTLINRRGLLRIGMILTESKIATTVRNYLLNIEEISDDKQKLWAIEREISKRERRQLTDAIKDFYNGLLKKGFEYATFTNLVYKVLFDSTAKQLKELYDLDKNDALRDSFATEDLRKVVNVERAISVLIQLGKDYDEIKFELQKNKERYQ